MPFVAPVVAHIDRLGYLRCDSCHPELAGEITAIPVHADSSHVGELCDSCLRALEPVPTQYQSWDASGHVYAKLTSAQQTGA